MSPRGLTVIARLVLVVGLFAVAEVFGHSCAGGYGLLIPLFAPAAVALTFYWDTADIGWPTGWTMLVSGGVPLVFVATLIFWTAGTNAAHCG